MEEAISEAFKGLMPPAILIVEDEILIRLDLAENLTNAGYDVLQAADVSEALQVLRSEFELDLLISDIRLTGPMTGIDLARWARAVRPGLPVMFISGNLSDIPADLIVDGLIEKPYAPAVVIASVQQLLSRQQKWQTSP